MSKLFSIVFIPLILFTVLTGCTTVPMVSPIVTPGQNTSSDHATIPLTQAEATIPAKTPDAQSKLQRLRITNQSNIPLHNLVVRFPDERIEYGDVTGGTTTEYRETPYPYGARIHSPLTECSVRKDKSTPSGVHGYLIVSS